MKKLAAPFIMTALFSTTLFASDIVLVPVFYGNHGAYGAEWRTRLTVFNNSNSELPGIGFIRSCGIPEGCPTPLQPKQALSILAGDGTPYATGFFLDPGVADADVTYSLRVFDESRGSLNFGTDIPVVFIDSFSEAPLELLGVPIDPNFRVTVRIYAIPPALPSVRATVFLDPPPTSPRTDPQILAERIYALEPPLFSFPGLFVASYSSPSALVVTDLLNGVDAGPGGSVRIELQSAKPQTPIWGLATVTNNETQLVSVIQPRIR